MSKQKDEQATGPWISEAAVQHDGTPVVVMSIPGSKGPIAVPPDSAMVYAFDLMEGFYMARVMKLIVTVLESDHGWSKDQIRGLLDRMAQVAEEEDQ